MKASHKKITKSSFRAAYLAFEKERVQEVNRVCPTCTYSDDDLFRYALSTTWVGGFFKVKYWKQYNLKCKRCGTEWESEKFEWT